MKTRSVIDPTRPERGPARGRRRRSGRQEGPPNRQRRNSSQEYLVTTEDFRFAFVNQVEGWHLVAGPRSVVERLLGIGIDEAWARFSDRDDAPLFDDDLPGIRSVLERYVPFGGNATAPIFAKPETDAADRSGNGKP